MSNDKDKAKSVRNQFRTSEENYDMLKGYDYERKLKIERDARKSGEDYVDFLTGSMLTMQKLKYSMFFPQAVDISLFTQLARKDPECKLWMSRKIFNKIDLSYGRRSPRYNFSIDEEDTGWLSELNEKYFYEPHADTLLVACTLIGMDKDDGFSDFRIRLDEGITDIKEHMENLEQYFDDSIEGIINAILLGKVSDYKAQIYMSFLYDFVVERNNHLQSNIDKHSKELKDALLYLLKFNSIKNNEVSVKQGEEAQEYL